MKSGFLLDVVIRESSPVFKLLSSEDEPLLIWRDSFLVLDLSLHILNGVRSFHLESDSFASQGLYEDLHPSSQSQNKMKSGFLLDVVVGESSPVLQLFACEDQSLLVWRNSFLVLNLGFHVLNGVGGFNLEGDRLPSQSLHEDLHSSSQPQD